MTEKIKIVVLIPTHGRPKLLRRTLESLADCRKPANYDKTIIVENGGKFGSEKLVEEFSAAGIEYLYCPEAGKSAALNFALEFVRDSLIVFSDDDARFSENYLEEYAKIASDDGRGKIYGGPVGVDCEVPVPEELRRFFPLSVIGFDPDEETLLIARTKFLGINWAAMSEDVRKAGGFDSALGPGGTLGATGQEADMQSRLIGKGFEPVFLPNAKAWHYVPADRSSPEWALRRARKVGVSKGMRAVADGKNLKRFVGNNRRNILYGFLIGLKNFATGRKYPFFQMRYARAQTIGALEGVEKALGGQ